MGFSEYVQSVTEVRGCKNSKYQLDLLLSDNVMVLTSTMIQVCHSPQEAFWGEVSCLGQACAVYVQGPCVFSVCSVSLVPVFRYHLA